MHVWSICTWARAHKWDYSLNEWCSQPKANKSVITCLGPWWQSLCWWQRSGNEEERITYTFHLALAWSSLHRGHLGRNATILPVIKLLIQPQRAHFHLILQSIRRLISLPAAVASQPPHYDRKQRWEEPEPLTEVHRESAFSYFTHFYRLQQETILGKWSGIVRVTLFYTHCLQVSVLQVILVSVWKRALEPLQGISWKIAEITC